MSNVSVVHPMKHFPKRFAFASLCLCTSLLFLPGCTNLSDTPSSAPDSSSAQPTITSTPSPEIGSSSSSTSDFLSTWYEQIPGEDAYVEVYEKDGKLYRAENGEPLVSSSSTSDSLSTWYEQIPGEDAYVEVYEKDGKLYRAENGELLE